MSALIADCVLNAGMNSVLQQKAKLLLAGRYLLLELTSSFAKIKYHRAGDKGVANEARAVI
jgi:hypothetical protein